MIDNQLNLLSKIIKASFSKALSGVPNTELQTLLARKITSTKDSETYTFGQIFGTIKEWLDERHYDTGKSFEYVLKNKHWNRGFTISRDYLEDLKSSEPLRSQYQLDIEAIADSFVNHPDVLIEEILEANGNAFDGSAFFANSRPNIVGGSGLDNIYSGTGVTLALLEADLSGAMNQMNAMKIDGRPLNKGAQFQVLIPTHLERLFRKLKDGENINPTGLATETNTLAGTFEISLNYEQSISNNDWYLVNKRAPIQPLILQSRKNPEYKQVDDPNKLEVGESWDARYNVGYANPFAIIKIDN